MNKALINLFIVVLLSVFFPIGLVLGVTGKFWKQESFKEFIQGTPEHTAVFSDGTIKLSPTYKSIYKVSDRPYIWSSATDSKGNLIIGTGSNAAVFKLDHTGKEIWKKSLEGLEVMAIAVDSSDNIFAAVSPDGIIYKISSDGKIEKYYTCNQRYIWALTINKSGELFASTGTKGIIFKITGKGKGNPYVSIQDSNITALTIGPDNNLYGGTDKKGYIFKVDPQGKIFVLYDAPESEIKSLIFDRNGNLYAAAVNKIAGVIEKPKGKKEEPVSENDTNSNDFQFTVTSAQTTKEKIAALAKKEQITPYKSVLYKIDKDNRVKDIFKTSQTTIFDLAIGANGEIFVCGGENGRIYSVYEKEQIALIMEVENKHLSTMASFNGKIFVCSSNEAEVYLLENGYPDKGFYYSDVHDTGTISTWGVIKWLENLPPETNIRLYTRTGNTEKPDNTWSEWSSPYLIYNGVKITSPNARYIQWRAMLKTLNKSKSPTLDLVDISYLPLNAPPDIEEINFYPKGIAVSEPRELNSIDPRLLSILQNKNSTNKNSTAVSKIRRIGGKKYYQEGALTVIWEANDPNGDELEFDLYYKRLTDKTWKILEENIIYNYYTWDTKTVSDDLYRIKLTANDSPDTPEKHALKTEKISGIITIDNTGPEISKPEVKVGTTEAIITFNIKDNLTPVVKCRYSVNAEKWKQTFPNDGIGDTLKEEYSITIRLKARGEYTVVIQAEDADGNITTSSATFNK